MKVLDLNKEIAVIQFLPDELMIVRNSLMEGYQQIRESHKTLLFISRAGALHLSKTIVEIINLFQEGAAFTPNPEFVLSIQLVEYQTVISLTYAALDGIRSFLSELCHGSFSVENFRSTIGYDKSSIFELLDRIFFDVVQKMYEDRPETLIGRKALEMASRLHAQFQEQQEVSSSSKNSKDNCTLKLNSHLIGFSLLSPGDNRIFSGIRLGIVQKSGSHIMSHPTLVRNFDLVWLVAYLELALTSRMDRADLERFSLLAYETNYTGRVLFELKIIPELANLEGEDVKVYFRFQPASLSVDIDDGYLRIEDTTSASNIYSFVSSIQGFLSKLPRIR